MTNNTKAYAAILAVACASLAAGCSGGGSSTVPSTGAGTNVSGNSDNNSNAQIQGIATPSSVSVVTATNQ